MNFDTELDARGLNCPLPILRSKKALTGMASGQVLRVLSTDPGSVKDFAAFAKQTAMNCSTAPRTTRCSSSTSSESSLRFAVHLRMNAQHALRLNQGTSLRRNFRKLPS